jgi:hypothetical protein
VLFIIIAYKVMGYQVQKSSRRTGMRIIIIIIVFGNKSLSSTFICSFNISGTILI